MMGRILVAGVLTLCVGISACGDGVKPDGATRELTESEVRLIEADNEFGLKLFKETIEFDPDVNVFVSPLSASMALGMTYNGAGGSTEEAMREVLAFGDLTNKQINESYRSLIDLLTGLDRSVEFGLANSIWCRREVQFKAEFLNVNRTYFDAVVQGLDFSDPSAAPTINNWVKNKTNGRIEEIVDDPIGREMIMFLINAVYFKGAWTYEFDPEKTRDEMFETPDGSEVPCRMMTRDGDTLSYHATGDFQAVDLPYGGGDFSMVVLLPRGGMDADALASRMTQESWDRLLDGFRTEKIVLGLPKFKTEYEISLQDVLTSLGMGVAFSRSEADFTGLYEGINKAYLSEVKHKTFVEVNEQGTEAAAVTSVGVGRTSLPPTVWVDRPFLFVIHERSSGAILFIGKIVEPTLN